MTETNVVYVPNTAANGESSTNGQAEKKTVRVHVSPDRLNSVKVGTWRKIEDGKGLSGMAELVELFLWNGHSYLPAKEAREVADSMTTGELKAVAEELMKLVKETTASPQ